MTAEIAILNKHGVALAADSAVSIGSKKIFNSANKLFALTKHHPVGIMVYGNANFMGIPWETIIKYYRRHQLGKKNFASLSDFSQDFLKFLTSTKIITLDQEERYLRNHTQYLCGRLISDIQEKVKKHLESASIDAKQTAVYTAQEITDRLKYLANLSRNPSFTAAVSKRIETRFGTAVDEVITKEFEKLPLTSKTRTLLRSTVIASLGIQRRWEGHSGIVIAGFGKDEIFPRVEEFHVEGRIASYLKVNAGGVSEITLDTAATIRPFAQREMVDTFMAGINPDFHENIQKAFELIVKKVPEILATKASLVIPKDREADVVKSTEELLRKFREELEEIQQRHYVRPVTSSVAALPLDELAAMAESLVNLTSFKRKVSMVQESVGGPIDVAVISKGDGFIWIKRKHYFSAEINHHFFSNNED